MGRIDLNDAKYCITYLLFSIIIHILYQFRFEHVHELVEDPNAFVSSYSILFTYFSIPDYINYRD